jgi:nicotinate-nucleotide adenylyltransferase
MTRTLLYGGSFDPPHLGHTKIPFAAMKHLAFDQVLYVPAFQSPLKQQKPTDNKHRIAMLELALDDSPWASTTTIEIDRGGTSYTIDTIEQLHNEYDELRLLIGADQWEQFKEWHRWEDIVKLANPAIMPRDGFNTNNERLLPIPQLCATSTTIRKRVHDGLTIDDFVVPAVAEYIAQHGLYL